MSELEYDPTELLIRVASRLMEDETTYVVSTLALLGFDDETRRMKLLRTQPGVTVDQVVAETGFELILPDRVEESELLSAEELHILREEVDRQRLYI